MFSLRSREGSPKEVRDALGVNVDPYIDEYPQASVLIGQGRKFEDEL